jgi:hypothetical protein
MKRRPLLWVAALVLAIVAPAIAQQRGERGGQRVDYEDIPENVPYDGRFTFVRIRYDMGLGSGRGFGRGGPPWAHDWPRGERHFTTMLSELSTVNVRTGESIILTLDDPELTKYPVAYMAEPGFWSPSEREAEGMRKYLQKGGFFIFDDFQGQHWYNFESQLRRVLPEGKLIPLTVDHPIFNSFYKIETLEQSDPVYGAQPEYFGVFEDNDPSKRMMVLVNYNQDLSEYWEFSDVGAFPIELSNEAYKLGVNYIIYALSR